MGHTEYEIPTAESDAREAWFEIRFSSLRELLPGICQLASSLATGSSTVNSPKLAIVLRELLMNAIEHGNHNEPGRVVALRVNRIGGQCVEIAIEDQGAGFRFDDIDVRPLDAPTDCCDGGLRLVSALSDSMSFDEEGRRVVCRLSWDPELRSEYIAERSHIHHGRKE